MIPIFEQGNGEGIGHSFNSFLRQFIQICQNHLETKRAKAFAFILYDFNDVSIKKVLRNQGGFTRLDRLAGKDLSVFYLHSYDYALLEKFNDIFLYIFDIKQDRSLPFVLFFKMSNGEACDVELVELEHSNIMFAFDELYGVVESYIAKLDDNAFEQTNMPSRFLRLFKSVKKVAGEKFIEYIMNKYLENI